ncbi:MAG TPA: hypothetical protein VGF13_04535, partial [Verrucomicrobiae bacterium]
FVLDDGDGDPDGDGAYRKSEGIHPHQGTIAIVAGNAGAAMSRRGTVPLMRKTLLEFGSVIVDVNGDTLTGKMINRSGKVRDLFSMVKRGKVEPTRLALPWKPDDYQKPTNQIKEIDYKVMTAPPIDYKVLIPKFAEWQYVAGEDPQGLAWTRKDFDASKWKRGPAGFGFGDAQFRTTVTRERGSSPAIYLRREFTLEQTDKITELGLMIDYRDGFIAYINGREVARIGIARSNGRNVQQIKSRETTGAVYIPLKSLERGLKEGVNVLAIEAHAGPAALDMFVEPYLILED